MEEAQTALSEHSGATWPNTKSSVSFLYFVHGFFFRNDENVIKNIQGVHKLIFTILQVYEDKTRSDIMVGMDFFQTYMFQSVLFYILIVVTCELNSE